MDIERDVIRTLRQVYDPEIPVNIYDLGLIYDLDIDKDNKVSITMTLTAPNCPMAEDLVQDVHDSVKLVPGVTDVDVRLTFEPVWTQDRMSEDAKMELGML